MKILLLDRCVSRRISVVSAFVHNARSVRFNGNRLPRVLFPAFSCLALLVVSGATFGADADVRNAQPLSIIGQTVTPHVVAESMRYRIDAEPAPGARVQLFIQNVSPPTAPPLRLDAATDTLFNEKSPQTLLSTKDWAWHDTPSATPGVSIVLEPGALTVWTFNSRSAAFGPGGRTSLLASTDDASLLSASVKLERPEIWLSAITFLAPEGAVQPTRLLVHIANDSKKEVQIHSCRLWLPKDAKSPKAFYAQHPLTNLQGFNQSDGIPSGDRGGFSVETEPLPLTYAVVQVEVSKGDKDPVSIWAHRRIKAERFDISGGWVSDGGANVRNESFLRALKRIHVNTAHLAATPGYTDTELYAKYPLKYFNALQPIEAYDVDEILPRIHAVEFLGEPQYGGGRPVPPQEVWEKLQPYVTSRLATTVTHSEERIWRDYAGLSDFPHYDAYRVSAPSPDAWMKYDRWDGERIAWGAPLETIGDMCRSLRELNRPMPCAYWSQGPHEGWDVYGGRKRTTPTPDEIRLQAYHAVSTRITSLYWFNLSLKTIVKWRDTLDELGRIGRELRMLDEFLLEGDAYGFERIRNQAGKLDWDIASVCGPRAALLFALDLDYVPDSKEKVFRFADPRNAEWEFKLPGYLSEIQDVFRVDADGITEVSWAKTKSGVRIRDAASKVAIYIATPDKSLRTQIEARRNALIAEEASYNFDPARNDADFAALQAALTK
ncbi:MAG TPA: hypothetical protein PLJ47_02000 [Candidatus Hydrogenedentes bacterium]|nr:hypothetical protein [Candidatus Hydrogenedentota bacterium]HRK33339.1 hypothetical protein [Candidatus Hydrogenedentota bacterium]